MDQLVEGLSHITFVVGDLEESKKLFVEIFDAEEIYSSDGEKLFLVGGVWIAVMESKEVAPPAREPYDHVAFKVSEEDLALYTERVRERVWSLGLEVRESRPRVEGEGRSLYFHDRDGHLFELHTGTLKERLERYEK